MALNDIYESTSNWLKAADIPKGSKPIVTIESAVIEESNFADGPKKQIVLSFTGKEKKLGLNFTNAAKIAELTGSEEYQDWVGVTIKLMVERVKYQNGMVDAIRIFPELPSGTLPNAVARAAAAPQQFTGPADDDLSDVPF